MSWLQLRLDCDKSTADALEAQLLGSGALSVTFEDREDEPLLEPGVGETPLWQAIRITGLFNADTDMQRVLATLPEASVRSARVEILEDRDWSREWMQHYQAMRFGERLWICPSWLDPPDPDAVNLLLDPGLAFGTGTHPTTAMCLRAVERLTREEQQIVDYGCGSGILGIAALRLGAAKLLAVDNDPQALTATRANAERNAIDPARLTVSAPDAREAAAWKGRADLVLANILAGPLEHLAPRLCGLLKPGGHLILAGLLETQADDLIAAYSPYLALGIIDQQDEWVCLAGFREGKPMP